MARQLPPLAQVLILVDVYAASAHAYQPGDKIVVMADAKLTVGTRQVDDVWPGLTLTVTDVNGTWLWVSNSTPGWLDQRHVIPLDRAAIDRLTAMIRAKPRDSGLYRGRALVWSELGELDIAIADLNEAIRLNPSAANHHSRACLWRDKDEYDRAIADFSEAIRLDSSDASYTERGRLWNDKGEYDRAIADFNEALRLEPRNSFAYNNRGVTWKNKGEYDIAIADYTEALRLDPKFATAYNNRGLAWKAKGELDKAIADFSEVLRIDPKDDFAFYNRGAAWNDKGEYDRAIADYNQAIRISPKHLSALNSLAWLHATCPVASFRNGSRAVQLATMACEIAEWKDGNVIDTLAAAYAEAGNFDEATAMQQRAVDLVPKADKADYQSRVELYQRRQPFRDTP